jgi:S-adenosylmethionine:diacylglycerol 3-amino-3-carboxypropyl transferase
MNGDFKNHLPHYARKENYEIIKQRIERVEFKKGYIQDFASTGYQAYNLVQYFRVHVERNI